MQTTTRRAQMATKAKKKTSDDKKRYKYVVAVLESVESKTEICSDKKMSWKELEKEAERRRIAGTLTFSGVREVGMWCEAAFDRENKTRGRILA